jgi:subtilisin family serine protease
VRRKCRQERKGRQAADGRGVTVAILDSGISANHADFAGTNNKSRVIAAVDFTGSSTTGDPYGHGTGVAGMVAGNGATSNGYEGNYAGSAPGQTWLT